MNTSFFSIIIPTYNCENKIQFCLKSILNQSFTNFEVLIIDGVSADKTVWIARSFKDSRIKIYSGKDKGIYDAMNKGIDIACGEWLYFLGADDVMFSDDTLLHMHNILYNTPYEFVYGNVQIVGNNIWAKDGAIYDGEFNRKKIFKKNICHQSVFYSKSVFANGGNFNIAYTTCADWDFNHRCFSKFRTQYVPEIISKFHAGGESTKNTLDNFVRSESVLNLKKYYRISYLNKLFRSYSWAMWNVSNNYLRNRKFFKSIFFFLLACYHSNHKIALFKNYLVNMAASLKGVKRYIE